jgi:hypothetical protein
MQKPGAAEAEFARNNLKYVLKKIYGMCKPAPLIIAKDKTFFDSLDSDGSCPAWLSEEDVSYYADKFEKTGFTGGLNYYRCMDLYVSYLPVTISALYFSYLLVSARFCPIRSPSIRGAEMGFVGDLLARTIMRVGSFRFWVCRVLN